METRSNTSTHNRDVCNHDGALLELRISNKYFSTFFHDLKVLSFF